MIKSIKTEDIKFKIIYSENSNFWNNYLNWEKKEISLLKKNLKKNCIFVDVGSWIGPYTILAAKKGLQVYSFEPDPKAFKTLKKNLSLNKFKFYPKIYNYGLSNFEGKTQFYSNSKDFNQSESSLINYKNFKSSKRQLVQIKKFTKTLNEITEKNPKKKILLKIDIEGGEFLIEKEIYNFVKKNNCICFLSYHFFVFNKNKIKKNFHKLKTLFSQFFVRKIDTKNFFKISNCFN